MEMFDFICDTLLNARKAMENSQTVSIDALDKSVEQVDGIENYIDEMNEAITQFCRIAQDFQTPTMKTEFTFITCFQ